MRQSFVVGAAAWLEIIVGALFLTVPDVLCLLVFGAKRLPEMGRSLGSGMRGFKESLSGEGVQHSLSTSQPAPATTSAGAPTAAPAASTTAAPVAAPAVKPVQEPSPPFAA